MNSTMGEYQLTTQMILEHGRRTFPDSLVTTLDGSSTRNATFMEIGHRVDRLAIALQSLGVAISSGDRVATLCSNRQEHLELYFAVPGLGAVLHPLNIRLSRAHTVFTLNHSEDRVIFVEGEHLGSILDLVAEVPLLDHLVLMGNSEAAAATLCARSAELEDLGISVHDYEDLLAAVDATEWAWPALDERAAAFMCYTSGTTGAPKGVVYSHRARVLHTFAVCTGAALGLVEQDRALIVVPMFHVLAWGMPFAAWMMGSDMVLPGSHLGAGDLVRLVQEESVTCTAAVPTIFTDILSYAQTHEVDLGSLRVAWCGGSAAPESLRNAYRDTWDLEIVEGWGMTETSAVSTINYPSKSQSGPAAGAAGRILHGVEMRVVSTDGTVLPHDGVSTGEIQVRGPWVTTSYYLREDADSFQNGWLRTGDVGNINRLGYLRISDRLKDIIKSGGEWISSIELESLLVAHPHVLEAAVIGIHDDRYLERPLAFIVRDAGSDPSEAELREFLAERVAKWWVPDHWVFIDRIPRTTIGKIDKVSLRRIQAENHAPWNGLPGG